MLLQLSQVEEYMRYRKLPQDVRQQITEYYEHRYRRKFFNEEAILNGLSQGLKEVEYYSLKHKYTIIIHVQVHINVLCVVCMCNDFCIVL